MVGESGDEKTRVRTFLLFGVVLEMFRNPHR